MSQVITPEEHPEDYQSALGLIQSYQDTKKDNSIDAHFLSKEAIQKLLDNPDFDAFKVHHARAEDGTRTLVFEGVSKTGASLNTYVTGVPTCPPTCSWSA